jgi:hypothetical protein
VVSLGAIVILSESHIQYPVQAVLDAPVPTCSLGKLFDGADTATAQEIAPLGAGYTLYFPLCYYHAYALEFGPLLS